MFVHFNPNPIKRTDDCVIRAICRVLDLPWEKAYMGLCLKGLQLYDWGNNNEVWDAYLRDKGFVREIVPNTCPNCYTVEDFCQDHPTGAFVLGTGTHAVAVVDGNFYDSYYSGDKVPIYFYRKERA